MNTLMQRLMAADAITVASDRFPDHPEDLRAALLLALGWVDEQLQRNRNAEAEFIARMKAAGK